MRRMTLRMSFPAGHSRVHPGVSQYWHSRAKRIARAVGGHHGAWPTPAEEQAIKSDERGGAGLVAVNAGQHVSDVLGLDFGKRAVQP